MNTLFDNKGNKIELENGKQEWNYIQQMIDDNDFNCTVHIELDITKVEDEDGAVWLVAKDESGIVDKTCLYDRELLQNCPGDHYYCDVEDVLALIIGEYRTCQPIARR